MPIDPRLSLEARVADVPGAAQLGLNRAQANTEAGIRAEILRQNQQSGAQGIQQTKQSQAQQLAVFKNKLMKSLRAAPESNRSSIVVQALPVLESMGVTAEEAIALPLDNISLDNGISATNASLQQQTNQATAAQKDFQFFQSVIDDPNSTADEVRAAKIGQGTEATAGRLQSQQVSPGVFVDFDPNSGERSDPYREVNGEKVPLTRDEQLDLRLAEDVAGIKTKGAAETDVAVTRAELLADVAAKAKSGERITGLQITRMDEAVQQGLTSIDTLTDVNRGLEILKEVNTGGITVASKVVTDFFGSTSGKIGELNRILAQNVLDGLAAFPGAISDSERRFVERMKAGLSQGKEFNIAELNRLRNMLSRKIGEGEQAAGLLKDEFSIGLFDAARNRTAQGFAVGAQQQQAPAQPAQVLRDDGSLDKDAFINSLFE